MKATFTKPSAKKRTNWKEQAEYWHPLAIKIAEERNTLRELIDSQADQLNTMHEARLAAESEASSLRRQVEQLVGDVQAVSQENEQLRRDNEQLANERGILLTKLSRPSAGFLKHFRSRLFKTSQPENV